MQVACLPVIPCRVAASDTAYQISFAAIAILNGIAGTPWDASLHIVWFPTSRTNLNGRGAPGVRWQLE